MTSPEWLAPLLADELVDRHVRNWVDGHALIALWHDGWKEVRREITGLRNGDRPPARVLVRLRRDGEETMRSIAPRPRPMPEDTVRQVAGAGVRWAGGSLERWIEHARHSHSSGCGPIGNHHEATTKGIEVRHYTRAAWLAECLWHQYWMGANVRWKRDRPELERFVEFADEEDAERRAPPHPQAYDLETFFPWAKVRQLAEAAEGVGQLELFT